jgi:transposase-like protein
MAYAPEKKTAVRAAYIHQRLATETISEQHGVPLTTIRKWKQAAEKAGDDWDRQRAAYSMSARGMEEVAQVLLAEHLVQHQATVKMLQDDPTIPALERVKAMASLADSFNKQISAVGKMSPSVSKKAVALDVIEALLEFVMQHYPAAAPALSEVLAPFSEYLDAVMP